MPPAVRKEAYSNHFDQQVYPEDWFPDGNTPICMGPPQKGDPLCFRIVLSELELSR